MSPGFLILIVLVFGAIWLLILRPQKRRQIAQQDLLQSIQPGVEILTAGGLFGVVREVDDDELTVEIAPGTNVRLARRAVAAVIPPDEPETAGDDEFEPDREPEEIAAGGARQSETPS